MAHEYRNTEQTAKQLGLSPKSLANARCTGTGINLPFIKMGTSGSIRYRQADIDAYMEANTYNHTGEVKEADNGNS
ncbi:helix-turn-helix domain-containing protein [Candidatus Thioglobus sp.]|nr:helix-turn-helix domain-containing protein [Candidatus Thioglobus sp.]